MSTNNERKILDFSDYSELIDLCNQREDIEGGLSGRWYYCDDASLTIYYGTFGNEIFTGRIHRSYTSQFTKYGNVEAYNEGCKYWNDQPEYDEFPAVDGEYMLDLGDGEETYECESDDYYGIDCIRAKLGNREFLLLEDSDSAGSAVRKRWEDMAKHDKKEFICIIGEERLLQWAMGDSDSFGISSFDEFLDRVESVPEEEIASYDLEQRNADFLSDAERDRFENEFGFVPTVAYRTN